MTEKQGMKQPDEPVPEQQQTRRQQPGAQGAGKEADARADEKKLHENQERLNVGSDHKTPDMKKGHRGTFP